MIPEEKVSSRDELQEEARRLKVINLSRLRTKNALEKAIEKVKASGKPLKVWVTPAKKPLKRKETLSLPSSRPAPS